MVNYDLNRIIHLASLLPYGSQQYPRWAIEVNILGSVYVLEAEVPRHPSRGHGGQHRLLRGTLPLR